MEYTIRPLERRDASGILTLDHALAEADQGVVKLPSELPSSTEEMQRSLRSWFSTGSESAEIGDHTNRKGGTKKTASQNGAYWVAAACRAGTVPILGAAEIRRLPLLRIAHGGMFSLGVHPQHQGVGIGSALVERALAWATTQGLMRVELNVLADNTRAISLYERFGFSVEGRRRGFFRRHNQFEDDLIMAWVSPFI